MKVIFLDIDGVLIPAQGGRDVSADVDGRTWVADRGCIQRLNEICRWTGAWIVLSSTWRKFKGWQKILSGWGIQGQFLGDTPVFYGSERGDEIGAFLAVYDKIESYI